MKRKVTLKRIFHRDKWRIAIFFEFDEKLKAYVRSIPGYAFSSTHKCFYINDSEENLKLVFKTLKDVADVDISFLVSIKKASDSIMDHSDLKGTESIPLYPGVIYEEEFDDIPQQKTDVNNNGNGQENSYRQEIYERGNFDPVEFRISEKEGLLVIRFLGRYDPEWIREMRSYGKCYYDKKRKEWLLPWTQLAVDSLSDYFSSQGVEVRVRKNEVPEVFKELRNEMGNDVRARVLGEAALNGIEVLRRYLNEKRYSENTLDSYLSLLELFFKYFHNCDPLKITRDDISGFFHDYVLKLGYSASYQNQMVSAIKTYYRLCGKNRVNPDSLERPRRSRSLPKVFSKEEIMKIFSATRNGKHKLILWLAYSCGLRRSEVINIRLTDLHTDRGILLIREGKGKVDRMVPVPQKVWEKIRVYMNSYKPVTYLFEGQSGGKYSVESVYNVFKQSLRRAGIKKDVGIHSLRHSYATHLHESGLDIRYIQELLGHKSTRTTEIYTHVSRRDLFAIRSPIEDMEID